MSLLISTQEELIEGAHSIHGTPDGGSWMMMNWSPPDGLGRARR